LDEIVTETAIGKLAPSFLAKDMQGSPLQLTDSDGQSRIVVFIKPGCPACLDALSILNNFATREDYPIIHIFSLADQKSNQVYATNYSPQLPILTPEDSTTCERMYDIRAVPFAFAINDKRIIEAKSVVSSSKQFEQLLIHIPERISSSL
jgi:peroxiredoxin